jgi:NAD(P)-dependent dehydrogenase (short-subunit alcohol dehydrogenase family)
MGGYSSKEKRLAGQHVLITGGSAGIGLALAKLYVAAGCNVTLVARSKPKLDEAKEQLQSLPIKAEHRGSVQVFSADVTDLDKVWSGV